MLSKLLHPYALFTFATDEGTTGGGSTSQPPAADGQGNEPDYKKLYETAQQSLEELKKATIPTASYTSLQTTLNKAQQEKLNTEAALADLQNQFKSTVEQLTTQTGKLTNLEGAYSGIEVDLLAERTKATRLTLILKEFPQLASFETAGLIPEPTDAVVEGKLDEEKYRDLFKTFADKLSSVASAAKAQQKEGGSPPSPESSSPANDARSYQKLMNAAALRGDEAEFTKYQALYEAARKKP